MSLEGFRVIPLKEHKTDKTKNESPHYDGLEATDAIIDPEFKPKLDALAREEIIKNIDRLTEEFKGVSKQVGGVDLTDVTLGRSFHSWTERPNRNKSLGNPKIRLASRRAKKIRNS